jgi:hypothetical protein
MGHCVGASCELKYDLDDPWGYIVVYQWISGMLFRLSARYFYVSIDLEIKFTSQGPFFNQSILQKVCTYLLLTFFYVYRFSIKLAPKSFKMHTYF